MAMPTAIISIASNNMTTVTKPQKTNAADHFKVMMKKKLTATAITIANRKLGVTFAKNSPMFALNSVKSASVESFTPLE